MSSLPNSKSSFLRVAQGCGALALAGAMVLPMTPALAQNATPAADAAVAAATPQAAHQVAAATPTLDVSLPNGYNYDGVNVFLVTTEGGTVHVKGAGYTKEWRAQHGTVALYIAPANYAPSGYEIPTSKMLRFVEGQDFTIADDGTFEADLKVEAYDLAAYYFVDDDYAQDPTGGTKYDVHYEIHVVAEQKGQKPLTAQELWTGKNVVSTQALQTLGKRAEPFDPSLAYNALGNPAQAQNLYVSGGGFHGDIRSAKGVHLAIREKGSNTPVLATSDIIEFDHPTMYSAYRDGNLHGKVHVPANTLDASKKYVVEVWANDGYSESGEFLAPVVGKAPEGRGELLASQDLNFKGSDASNTDDKKPSLTDEQRKERATRGELAVALYLQAGAPEVKLPETSPWPDVKTDDPNYAAYIWVREKGISYGWSDGKFHADAGISNATVAAFTYRAAGSPAVKGDSPYVDVKPGAPFYREILWASQNLPTVYGGHYFIPKQLLTRGHLETVLTAFQSR